ncbi:MAG: VOC family protein [Dehalococcoidia bacterium]
MPDNAHAGHEQLVPVAPEFFVRDVDASIRFYVDGLGFRLLRRDGDFAVLGLGDAHVLLAGPSIGAGLKAWLASGPRGVGLNIRIMVDDIDAMYARVKAAGAPVVDDIKDQYYGLRDFMAADPDGFVLRFAAPIA